MDKQYLGDGVYIQRRGYDYELTTENGYCTTNIIFLTEEMIGHLYQIVQSTEKTDNGMIERLFHIVQSTEKKS